MSGRFVLALAGGVGGGKFARGLTAVLPPDELAIVVNTADDFVHLGLHICPDIDSVLYAIADLNDPERGWGLAGETWNFMDALRRLGAPAGSSSATAIWQRTCCAPKRSPPGKACPT